MKLFACPQCGADIHFDNLRCLNCGAELAFDPREGRMAALVRGDGAQWADPLTGTRVCANRDAIGCGWLAATGGARPLCISCGRTLVIPDQSVVGNRDRWARLESAKRLVFYGLMRLGLPFDGCGPDPEHLTFRLLGEADTPAGHETVTPVTITV